MLYNKDFLLRQIDEIIKILMSILGRRYDAEYLEDEHNRRILEDDFYRELMLLIEEKNINEAENLLYEKIEGREVDFFTAILFYIRLNKLSDIELKNADFSRKEVLDGIKEVAIRYELNLNL